MTGLFPEFTDFILYELGGENSYTTHRRYINIGLLKKDRRNKNETVYEQACYSAIKKDFEIKQTDVPNFYALIIKKIA